MARRRRAGWQRLRAENRDLHRQLEALRQRLEDAAGCHEAAASELRRGRQALEILKARNAELSEMVSLARARGWLTRGA